MNRNGYGTGGIIGINEDVMTADDSIDEKTGSGESMDDTLAVDDRKLAAAHLGGHRYLTDLGMRIRRRRHSLFLPVRQDGPDGFPGIGKRLLFGVAFRYDFRQCRDEHGKAATFLRFEDHRIAVACRHDMAPAIPRMVRAHAMLVLITRPRAFRQALPARPFQSHAR